MNNTYKGLIAILTVLTVLAVGLSISATDTEAASKNGCKRLGDWDTSGTVKRCTDGSGVCYIYDRGSELNKTATSSISCYPRTKE